MKVLLDECIPRKLKYEIPGHECQNVPEAGLAGKKNTVLLSLAEGAGYDIFFTTPDGVSIGDEFDPARSGDPHRLTSGRS
jgi:hypothetical protein